MRHRRFNSEPINKKYSLEMMKATEIPTEVTVKSAQAHYQYPKQIASVADQRGVMEISRRLHKIKRRLLLNVAAEQNRIKENNKETSIYSKIACSCRDDNETDHCCSPAEVTLRQ
mmetsp:Transcript_15237/g.18545  ORF Transcript_15237/g.18545 Transcript_15237/m.18545 type:complete len:115 (+) Transcript_15237:92-436(+)